MITIRCTQKLLRRVHPTDEPRPSTTRLGDWYANLVFARPEQLVLCVSERTLLAVVVLLDAETVESPPPRYDASHRRISSAAAWRRLRRVCAASVVTMR